MWGRTEILKFIREISSPVDNVRALCDWLGTLYFFLLLSTLKLFHTEYVDLKGT